MTKEQFKELFVMDKVTKMTVDRMTKKQFEQFGINALTEAIRKIERGELDLDTDSKLTQLIAKGLGVPVEALKNTFH
jgi:hypothetical protein